MQRSSSVNSQEIVRSIESWSVSENPKTSEINMPSAAGGPVNSSSERKRAHLQPIKDTVDLRLFNYGAILQEMEDQSLQPYPDTVEVIPEHNLAKRYKKDPATGFLLACPELQGPGVIMPGVRGIIAERAFSPSDKTLLLEALEECWPNITKACDKVGISSTTYRKHLSVDQLFSDHVQDIANRHVDHIESFQSDLAKTNKFAFLDRAMTLRANRPDKFDPARKIILSGAPRIDEPTARLRMAKLKDVVDAEIVQDGLRDYQDRHRGPRGRPDQ